MTKKELRMCVEMRLRELEACKQVGAPAYLMGPVNARINELEELLKRFGNEEKRR